MKNKPGTNYLFTCRMGYEKFMVEEIKQHGFTIDTAKSNWAIADKSKHTDFTTFCFPHTVYLAPEIHTGDSADAIADRLSDYFLDSLADKNHKTIRYLLFSADTGLKGIGRRISSVKKKIIAQVKERAPKVTLLDETDGERAVKGLIVFFNDYEQFYVSTEAYHFGQCIIPDDADAPSRSYQKVEEAYQIAGKYPCRRETVADLGAAPGGWSYSAAKHGAKVDAVDNANLKGTALKQAGITHINYNAFKFRPKKDRRYDWLFCDMVVEPQHSLNLLDKWIRNKWCKNFIVNLKFGWSDPLELIRMIRKTDFYKHALCTHFRIRHLNHDREEITLIGEVRQ